MSEANPSMDRANPHVGARRPEPSGDPDLAPSPEEAGPEWDEHGAPEEAEEAAGPLSARFEDLRVGIREISAGRCIIGVDLELVFEAPEPGAEDPEGAPEVQELELDAGEVEALLAERAPRAVALKAARYGFQVDTRAPQPPPPARWKIDRKKFFQGYAAAFSRLDRRQTAGLNALLTAAERDPALTDLRWLAYMLATVQHECAGTWRPIEEYGKGRGRPYGRPVVVTDPQGKKHRNVYFGRGYVQLTWKQNYQRMGKLLKSRLLYDPSLALRPAIAYKIMSLGMRRGLFTGKKLGDYIRGAKTDYVNARRIINALDRAQKIARNARKLEKLLRRSAGRVSARSAR